MSKKRKKRSPKFKTKLATKFGLKISEEEKLEELGVVEEVIEKPEPPAPKKTRSPRVKKTTTTKPKAKRTRKPKAKVED